MQRTPSLRSAAMLAREGTSCGAYSWERPWRERKATLRGGEEEDGCAEEVLVERGFVGAVRGWERMVMGLEGEPQGVWSAGWVSGRVAIGVKEGSEVRPVPPIIAMRRGPRNVRRGFW